MGGSDPVGDRLMINSEQPSDAAEAITFKVELERRRFSFLIVAQGIRLRRILAAAGLTLEPLAAGAVEASFDLALCTVAVGTLRHVKVIPSSALI